MLRMQLGIGPHHLAQQAAQVGGTAHHAVMERIDDMAGTVDADPDQEVRRKSQPFGIPMAQARDMQIEDRQRHRQPLAALDDTHEVGVLQVVVGF